MAVCIGYRWQAATSGRGCYLGKVVLKTLLKQRPVAGLHQTQPVPAVSAMDLVGSRVWIGRKTCFLFFSLCLTTHIYFNWQEMELIIPKSSLLCL